MGKKQKKSSSSSGGGGDQGHSGGGGSGAVASSSSKDSPTTFATWVEPRRPSSAFWRWWSVEREALLWLVACVIAAMLLGLGIGTGHLTGDHRNPQRTRWRRRVGRQLRRNGLLNTIFLGGNVPSLSLWSPSGSDRESSTASKKSSARMFHILREMVVREETGYVHPDLGFLDPAPSSGAGRGLGMISDKYAHCQMRCNPGILDEKETMGDLDPFYGYVAPMDATSLLLKDFNMSVTDALEVQNKRPELFAPEEILIRVPLSIQMTRTVALDTLTPLIPGHLHNDLNDLDDACLLVLLLVHERTKGLDSRFYPYIATLPDPPTCGHSFTTLQEVYTTLMALKTLGWMDSQILEWKNAWIHANNYARKIVLNLAADYGPYITAASFNANQAKGFAPLLPSIEQTISWALCQVSSRATAGNETHGSLRMVPLIDMINHDINAGSFYEITGDEKIELGDFENGYGETGAGSFVVRSLRHGRRKPLKKGQELLVNYNVPGNSAMDWFLSSGFIPSERRGKWTIMHGALPPMMDE